MPRSWGCWPGGMETTGIWLPYSRIWRAAKRKELSSQFCVTKRNQRGRMHTLQQLEVLIYKSYLITPSSPSLDKHLLRFHYVPAGAIQGLGISEWTRQTVPVLSWIFPFRLGWSRDGSLPALLPSAPHHRFASPFSFLSGYLCIYFSLCLIHLFNSCSSFRLQFKYSLITRFWLPIIFLLGILQTERVREHPLPLY